MNWAILATGTIAAKFAETVNGMKGEDRLAACGSRSREKAEAFGRKYGIPRAYGSYEELLRDEEVDAVYVATPNNMHYANCMACLEAGKHVLCEKPFTTNVKDGERLFAAAEERGLFIMEAFWIRHLPALKKMQELITGELSARWDLPGVISALWLKGQGRRASLIPGWAEALFWMWASITWDFCAWLWEINSRNMLCRSII